MKKNILIISTGVLSAYLAQFLLKKKYNIFVTTRKVKKKTGMVYGFFFLWVSYSVLERHSV